MGIETPSNPLENVGFKRNNEIESFVPVNADLLHSEFSMPLKSLHLSRQPMEGLLQIIDFFALNLQWKFDLIILTRKGRKDKIIIEANSFVSRLLSFV